MGKRIIIFIFTAAVVIASLTSHTRGAALPKVIVDAPTAFILPKLEPSRDIPNIEISIPSLPKLEKEASTSLDYIEGYTEAQSRV